MDKMQSVQPTFVPPKTAATKIREKVVEQEDKYWKELPLVQFVSISYDTLSFWRYSFFDPTSTLLIQ